MAEIDELSGLTAQEYRDSLKLAAMVKSQGWPVFVTLCEKYINDKKDVVFDNLKDQLIGNYDRGCGHGVDELLVLLSTQIELALAQEKRESEADSAEDKEK